MHMLMRSCAWPVVAGPLGADHSVLQLPAADSQGDLHDERDRVDPVLACKVTRKRGAFPTSDSVRKVLYLAIQRISQRWRRPIKDWVAALDHFAIVFKGRIVT
jgi:hypothetical protein